MCPYTHSLFPNYSIALKLNFITHVLEPHSRSHRPHTVLHASLALYLAAFEVLGKVYLISMDVEGVSSLQVSQASPHTAQKPQKDPSLHGLTSLFQTCSKFFTSACHSLPNWGKPRLSVRSLGGASGNSLVRNLALTLSVARLLSTPAFRDLLTWGKVARKRSHSC